MSSPLKIRIANRHDIEKYESYMDKFHYLGSVKGSVNKCLRYIVEDNQGEWVSLLDFGYAALKSSARDEFIGWKDEEKNKRLKYVLNNTRFLVLPWMRTKYHCAASQSLSLAVKRISSDWQHYHGHHILLLETFVDEQREGTCYRAANWVQVGETKGFGRRHRNYYEHGNKKKVFVFKLNRKCQEILSERCFPHPLLVEETKAIDLLHIST